MTLQSQGSILSTQQQQNPCVLRTYTTDLDRTKQIYIFIKLFPTDPLTKEGEFLDLRLQRDLHHLLTSAGSGLLERDNSHQSCSLRTVGKGNRLGGKNQTYFIWMSLKN